MADGAVSSHPGVQRQLDRLSYLSPGRDVLGLERISALLERLGNPQHDLPPVFHVAGTNGKGSTCAFLRAAIEASGQTVHVYTSPHLVRFNERFRIAGQLIEDERLEELLRQALDISQDIQPSFFEVATAVAFLAFAETPTDAVILEVGLGGRLDATNVVDRPAVCGIASLGIDHESFLLIEEPNTPVDPFARIAFEKAGIAKNGVPLVTQSYTEAMEQAIMAQAQKAGASTIIRGDEWDAVIYNGKLHYRDARGKLALPLPRMRGAHQADNAALALALLRHQDAVTVPESALRAMMEWAEWPARLQVFAAGPLRDIVPYAQIWLDGGHNADAGTALAAHFDSPDIKVHLIIGMLANKNPAAIIAPLSARLASIHHVPVPHHADHPPKTFAAMARDIGIPFHAHKNVAQALAAIDPDPADHILIAGSLYLAGEVLRENGQMPV